MVLRNGLRLLRQILRMPEGSPERKAVFQTRDASSRVPGPLRLRYLPKPWKKRQGGGPRHTWITWYWQSIRATFPTMTLDRLEALAKDEKREWKVLTDSVCAHIEESQN